MDGEFNAVALFSAMYWTIVCAVFGLFILLIFVNGMT